MTQNTFYDVKTTTLLLAAFFLSWFGGIQAARAQDAAEPLIVREVEYKWFGPETVSRQVLEANVQTVKDRPFSRIKVEQDVRTLMGTGYFLNVRVVEEVTAGGLKIRFDLQGKSTVRQVVFAGNKRFKEEKLRTKIKSRENDTLLERRVHEDQQALLEYYQKAGYEDVKVTETISFDEDTGQSVVTFTIEEGEKVKIVAVDFTGVKGFPENKLRKLMKTKKNWLFSFLSSGGRLRADQFEEDLELLRNFYHENGYIDMDFARTEENQRRGWRLEHPASGQLRIVIDIVEGKQYKVGSVTLSGNKLFPTADIEKTLKMKAGDLYTPEGLTGNIRAVRDFYGAKGYRDADVRALKSPNPQTGRMDLNYEIKEGDLNYIEKIVIRGNYITRDKVIRREMAVDPGDIYNTVKIDKSRERLQGLNYFSRVDMLPEDTSIPNHPDLVVELEEQRTGQLSFGAGFSSIDNLIGFAEVKQGNFDIFGWPNFRGGGQKMRLKVLLGTRRQDYEISFAEPWFLEQRLKLGFDLYHREADYLSSQYSESRTGGDVYLEKALGQWWYARTSYSLEDVHVNVDTTASAVLQAERGQRTKSAVSFSLTRDTRDNPNFTQRGNLTQWSAEVAGGPLGGNVDIYKVQMGTSFYFPVFEKHVLLLQANIGVVEEWDKGTRVPLFDRYFLGGASTIRGFKLRDVSPHDNQNQALGGRTFWNATTEYTFPIVDRIRGAFFFDVGNVYPLAYSFAPGRDQLPGGGSVAREFLNAGAGFGVRINSPLGPFRFDFGFPIINDAANDHGMQFHFNVGYQF